MAFIHVQTICQLSYISSPCFHIFLLKRGTFLLVSVLKSVASGTAGGLRNYVR